MALSSAVCKVVLMIKVMVEILNSVVATELLSTMHTPRCLPQDEEWVCGECCCRSDGIVTCSHLSYIPYLPGNQTLQLTMSHCKLPLITKDSFYNVSTRKLVYLSFDKAGLINIGSDAFSEIHNLETLIVANEYYLNHSQLRTAVSNLTPTLKEFVIQESRLQRLNRRFLSQPALSKLAAFRMINNYIQNLTLSWFEGMANLKVLNVEDNWVGDVDATNTCLPSLQTLTLRQNEIVMHPPMLCIMTNPFPELHTLDLSGNSIIVVLPEAFACLKNLRTLDLSKNDIKFFQNNVFSGLHSLERLDISQMENKLKHIEYLAFNVSTLKTLNISSNNLRLTYPNTEKDLFERCPALKILDMSGNIVTGGYITKILKPLKSLQILVMNNVGLEQPTGVFWLNLRNLTEVSLRNNAIGRLDNLFKSESNVRFLDVSKNHIRTLDLSTMSHAFLKNMRFVDISGNPFECTCELLNFRTSLSEDGYFRNVHLVGWPDGYYCHTPGNMKGRMLKDFHPTKESCSVKPSMTYAFFISGSAGGIILTVIMFLLWYKHRWYIRYWLYKKSNQPNNPERRSLLRQNGMTYDGYVIYDDEDREFAHGKLLEIMETHHDYSLHIWHRNADNGAKLEVMVDAMYASHSTVVVVSNNFLKNSWCHFQLDVALDRDVDLSKARKAGKSIKSRIILVLLEDIPYQELSQHWCVLLTKLNTAKWSSLQNDIRQRVFEQQISRHFEVVKQYDTRI